MEQKKIEIGNLKGRVLEVKQESDDEKRPMMRNDRRREKTDKNEQSKTYNLGTDQNKEDTICQEV